MQNCPKRAKKAQNKGVKLSVKKLNKLVEKLALESDEQKAKEIIKTIISGFYGK